MDDETPWDDINPPMTASARQHGLQTQSSAEKLGPAPTEQFKVELTSCLALVAPAGMTEENRRDWLGVAWRTLEHLPSDLLAIGCAEARKSCDHPAKIVPTILAATERQMRWRRNAVNDTGEAKRLPRPAYCTPAEAAQILKEYGLRK